MVWSRHLGANIRLGTSTLEHSVVLETNLDFDGTNTLFGRAEVVRKNAEDLAITGVPP